MEEKNKEFATVGVGTDFEREIEITDYLQYFNPNTSRIISICELEKDEGVTIYVINEDKHVKQSLFLSNEAFETLSCLLDLLRQMKNSEEKQTEVFSHVFHPDNEILLSDNFESMYQKLIK